MIEMKCHKVIMRIIAAPKLCGRAFFSYISDSIEFLY
jgi:hypothetical protein